LNFIELLSVVLIFFIIAVASNQLAKYYPNLGLPLITGFLLTGMIAGPFILGMIPAGATDELVFINEISLSFIAFAAGTELYLKELRGQMKSITWNTFGQFVVTFLIGSAAVYLLEEMIPFMQQMSHADKISVALLAGTIFVARSPASAIAIIDEMRAKGPFSRTAIGVTVVKDVLVIILFAITFAIAIATHTGNGFDLISLLVLLLELALSFGSGYLLYKLMTLVFSLRIRLTYKVYLILLVAYGVYLFSHNVRELSREFLPFQLYLEPLLISIIGSFLLTNYSRYRLEFQKVLQLVLPFVYVAFFTLTGASALLDVLTEVWLIALLLFLIRIGAMIIGGYVGGILAKDPPLYYRIGWMPYVTQAGVGIGLATVIADEFTTWGPEFETIIIAVIILNQIIGPPLFKWSIKQVGEDYRRATGKGDGDRKALIFGLESKSIALAQQLKKHGWQVSIASRHATEEEIKSSDIEIIKTSGLELEVLEKLHADEIETIITMMDDYDNFKVCELAFENFGTKNLVVRLNERANFHKFHKLGALIVNPATAIVSLMDHFVRSPQATSLLLGMEENQDSIDVEVRNSNMFGISLRELHLPADIIILSVTRGGQLLISHGFTRLRKGDIITLVGSVEALENVRYRFEGDRPVFTKARRYDR